MISFLWSRETSDFRRAPAFIEQTGGCQAKLEAPYPYLSLPVVLGTVGGVMLCIGTVGLLYLKARSDREPAEPVMLSLDRGFLVMLFLTSFTGLLLLALRETAWMGTLLVIHLGVVVRARHPTRAVATPGSPERRSHR